MKPESTTLYPIFDGHQDILSALAATGTSCPAEQFLTDSRFHLDSGKCSIGGWAGGFFAIWVASPGDSDNMHEQMSLSTYDLPLPEILDQRSALSDVEQQVVILQRLQAMGVLTVCTDIRQLRSAFASKKLAAVFHLEGCDAIDSDFKALDQLYEQGLRSLGPVWSRPTLYGHGVPFRFPATPDIGPGLTELGIELIQRCNEKRILVDLSHLNLAGFNDVARISKQPLVATHSNAHSLCRHARNLDDAQLEAIKDSQGMVGLNFACAFLRQDGRMLTDTPVEQMIRHLDYLLDKLGEQGVGIGSDFDGADVPDAIGSASGLPVLVQAMLDHDYGQDLVRKICHENWLSVLERTWSR